MEEVCAACVVYETCLVDYTDLKPASGEVWLLEKKYNIHDEMDIRALKRDAHSILWFTYRKQFPEIGNTGLTSDFGWGCMHRCGQMVLAQAFIRKYLGKDWVWETGTQNTTYFGILNMFNDREECHYSVHNIALRGKEMDKNVGQWFGPNTVAQVLKKLASEDGNTDIVIHVAMDNMIVTSEIKNLCKGATSCDSESDILPVAQDTSQINGTDCEADEISNHQCQNNDSTLDWQPLLLIIPLRLGLTNITEKYFEKLKASFTIKGCLGILGGRTNHASYFIGYTGDELIFLDPHTTQHHCLDVTAADETYHCEFPGRMSFSCLDPSIAMCFYCDTEEAFDDWCQESQKLLLEPREDAIFEILEKKPAMLPYLDLEYPDDATCQGVAEATNERIYTSDDEFELLC